MKIMCISYRDWALKIYEKLVLEFSNKYDFKIISSKSEFDKKKIHDFNPDIILWYGWSWFVEKKIINNYNSIMLHPSPLPKYRGGSPIQNQIINGESVSAVTLFKMTENLDDGDIYFQQKFSLEGSLDQIFERITDLGYAGTLKILNNDFKLISQDNSDATYFKRRRVEESEITIDEIKSNSAEFLHNKIRMLNDPYPNAFIKCADGKKLFLIKSKI